MTVESLTTDGVIEKATVVLTTDYKTLISEIYLEKDDKEIALEEDDKEIILEI